MTFYLILVVAYIKQYEKGEENITFDTLWPEMRRNFFKVFFSAILLFIVIYIGFIFCLIPGIFLAVALAPLLIIMVTEERRFGDSWSRSFFLTRDHWWESFGLYFVTALINMAISFIIILPMYIFIFVKMFAGFRDYPEDPEMAMDGMSAMSWFMPVFFLLSLLTNMIFITVITFKYYSLVEVKEGLGEKEAIENIT
jgi:hypothetical protein